MSLRLTWLFVCAVVYLAAGSPAHARSYCEEIAQLARENWDLFAGGGDPAHRAAAQNYQNAHAAYCSGGDGSTYSGGVGGNPADIMGTLGGILGILAALSLDPEDVAPPPPRPRAAPSALTEAEMQQLREDAERELEETRRRCQQANPFGETQGCGAPENPFLPPEDSPSWDSVKQRDCGGTIDFGPDGCVPDRTRTLIASLRESVTITIPKYKGEDYSGVVLTPEQFRRLAAGEDFDEVTAIDSAMLDSITAAFNRKIEAELQALKASEAAGAGGAVNPFE